MQTSERNNKPAAQHGFTLLEAVIALVIVALALEVVVRSAAAGLAAARRERATLEAIARAQAHLAELTDPAALLPGRFSGDDGGGYAYVLLVTPLGVAPPLRGLRLQGGVPPLKTALYQVEVTISWQEGRREGEAARAVSLTSQAIAPVPP